MFTLICCSLAGLKMSLRTGFCCRNFLAQDKNQSAPKTVPELAAHWHSRGPQSKLHASFAVLGWGLATTGSIGMAPSHLQYLPPDLRCHLLTSNILPPDVRWHLLTCNILPADLRWHLLTCNILPPDVAMAPSHLQYFTARCAMAPSHLQIFHLQYWDGTFSPAIFYRQICDGTFSPAIFYLQICDGTFSPAIFYRQMCDGTFSPAIFYRQICDGTFSPWKCFFTGRFAIAPSHLQYFTARCAMAPSHLQYFYRQMCDGIFSPWNFFPADLVRRLLTCKFFHLQIWHGTFQGCQMHRKQKWSSQNSDPNWNHRNNHEIRFGPNQNIIFHPKYPNFAENHELCENHQKKNRNALQPNCTTINAIIVTNTTNTAVSIEVALCTTNHHAKTPKGHKRHTKGHKRPPRDD